MKRNDLFILIRFAVVISAQLFIFNNVHIAGFVIPIIYIYCLLKLPLGMSKLLGLLLAFCIGGIIDVFMGTYAINAAATTIIGFLRPYTLKVMFGETNDRRETTPSIQELGLGPFFGYISILTFTHIFSMFFLEKFSFNQFGFTLLRVFLCSLFSIVLIMLYELLANSSSKRKKKR